MIERKRFERVARSIQRDISIFGLRPLPIFVEDVTCDGFSSLLAKWSNDRPKVALYAGKYFTSNERDWWFGFESASREKIEQLNREASVLPQFKDLPRLRFEESSTPLLSSNHALAIEPRDGVAFESDPETSYFGRYVVASVRYSDEEIVGGAIRFISQVVETLDPLLAEKRDLADLKAVDSTTRKQLIDARRGQGNFRQRLEAIWHGCAVLGCQTRQALRASHIKPWSVSSDEERLSHENGLLLTATLDALFDKHLITFDNDGRMLITSALSDNDRRVLGLNARLVLRREPSKKQREFLEIHRKTAERRWGKQLSPSDIG